jgi:hypothetical protein
MRCCGSAGISPDGEQNKNGRKKGGNRMNIRPYLSHLSCRPFLLVGMLLLTLLLAACDGGGAPSSQSGSGDEEAPVQVVKDFVAALKNRDVDAMMNYISSNEETARYSPEIQNSIDLLEKLNIENEQYTLEENDGTNAKVRLKATVSYAVRGVPLASEEGETIFSLIKLGDRWYIRNIQPVIEQG